MHCRNTCPELPKATVIATDISAAAIKTAQVNAHKLHASVTFLDHNILVDPIFDQLDCIISNPPYIRESEKTTMALNVTNFEPPGALFVPNNDPLIFHRAIALKGTSALKPGVCWQWKSMRLWAKKSAPYSKRLVTLKSCSIGTSITKTVSLARTGQASQLDSHHGHEIPACLRK